MKKAHSLCYEEINEECSRKIHKKIGLEFDDTQKCVNNTFSRSGDYNSANEKLKAEKARWKQYGAAYWPMISINEKTFRGDIIPDNVIEDICSSFISPSSSCVAFMQTHGLPQAVPSDKVNAKVLIWVIVILILLNFILICLYR